MIRYTLKCDQDHAFEAWFRNSATYDAQASAGEVRCPQCGSTAVSKALMAPAVARGRGAGAPVADAPSAETPSAGSSPPAGSAAGSRQVHYAGKVREMLVEMRRHIESNADYVGDKFAAEARKIHAGESEERSIYGEATDQEAEALHDDGIEFGRIPWLPKDDA